LFFVLLIEWDMTSVLVKCQKTSHHCFFNFIMFRGHAFFLFIAVIAEGSHRELPSLRIARSASVKVCIVHFNLIDYLSQQSIGYFVIKFLARGRSPWLGLNCWHSGNNWSEFSFSMYLCNCTIIVLIYERKYCCSSNGIKRLSICMLVTEIYAIFAMD